jgi:hypothetical protein
MALTVFTALVLPRTTASVLVGSVGTFGLIWFPLRHLPWFRETGPRRNAALALGAVGLGLIAWVSWPSSVENPEIQLAIDAQKAATHCREFQDASIKRRQRELQWLEETNNLIPNQTDTQRQQRMQWRLALWNQGEMKNISPDL